MPASTLIDPSSSAPIQDSASDTLLAMDRR